MDINFTRTDFCIAVNTLGISTAMYIAAEMGISNTTIDLWCITM